MTLTEFCVWYKSKQYPKNTNQWSGKIYLTDCSSSSIVYAHENFLVEEYHLFPNAIVPPHNHPFETISIFLGGSFNGYRSSGGTESYRLFNDQDIGIIGNPLPIGVNHGFTIGPNGATLLVVSEWNDLSQRNSATVEYEGEPMGPIHSKLLETEKIK